MLFPVFFVAVYLSHVSLLRLPYYWDEAGYYIPAAYDFFRTGSLIPHSTLTNAHPPLPSLLLAAWWSFAGFVPSATRTLMCLVTAMALLGVYQVSRILANAQVAIATTLLTALYPVWFAQSTLAHADMFAAAATMWALAAYFRSLKAGSNRPLLWAVAFFALAAMAKETAIVNALVLAAWELSRVMRGKVGVRGGVVRAVLLGAATAPLAIWYAYHRHKTGSVFGNPEFLHYNAVATLTPLRVLLAFGHRVFHVTAHMNMFVPTICMIAAMFLPPRVDRHGEAPPRIRPPARHRQIILVLILANLILFSVLGGALLTRYLLPVYPLFLLAAVSTWWRRVPYWGGLVAFSAVAFFLGLVVNPPYRFAPEDNLAYRDMIVLHQHAAARLLHVSPRPTVLTAWPAADELSAPWLGYVKTPLPVVTVDDFTREHLASVKSADGASMAFIFSTKYAPPTLPLLLGQRNEQWQRTYFGFHEDLNPADAAALLGGRVVWYEERKGQWAALIALHTH